MKSFFKIFFVLLFFFSQGVSAKEVPALLVPPSAVNMIFDRIHTLQDALLFFAKSGVPYESLQKIEKMITKKGISLSTKFDGFVVAENEVTIDFPGQKKELIRLMPGGVIKVKNKEIVTKLKKFDESFVEIVNELNRSSTAGNFNPFMNYSYAMDEVTKRASAIAGVKGALSALAIGVITKNLAAGVLIGVIVGGLEFAYNISKSDKFEKVFQVKKQTCNSKEFLLEFENGYTLKSTVDGQSVDLRTISCWRGSCDVYNIFNVAERETLKKMVKSAYGECLAAKEAIDSSRGASDPSTETKKNGVQ